MTEILTAEEYDALARVYVRTLARVLDATSRNRDLPGDVIDKLGRVRVLSERNEWIAWAVYDSNNGEGSLGGWTGYLPTVWEGCADPEDMRESIAAMAALADR